MLDAAEGAAENVVVSDITFNFASGYYELNGGLIKANGTHPLWVFDNEVQKYKFKLVEDVLPENIKIPSAVFTIGSPTSNVTPEKGAVGTVLFLIWNLVCLIPIFVFYL